MYACMYVYIYIYREREREIHMIHTYVTGARRRRGGADFADFAGRGKW